VVKSCCVRRERHRIFNFGDLKFIWLGGSDLPGKGDWPCKGNATGKTKPEDGQTDAAPFIYLQL
jgi:hypothetical protein